MAVITEVFFLYALAMLYYLPVFYAVWGDVIGLLMKIARLKKEPRGYETIKLFLKSEEYEKHKKEWRIKFIYPLIICGIAWIICKITGVESAMAVVMSHFVLGVSYIFIASKEAKARKNAKQEFLNRQ